MRSRVRHNDRNGLLHHSPSNSRGCDASISSLTHPFAEKRVSQLSRTPSFSNSDPPEQGTESSLLRLLVRVLKVQFGNTPGTNRSPDLRKNRACFKSILRARLRPLATPASFGISLKALRVIPKIRFFRVLPWNGRPSKCPIRTGSNGCCHIIACCQIKMCVAKLSRAT